MSVTGHQVTRLRRILHSAAISKAEIQYLEDLNMHGAKRFFGSLILTVALIAPVSVIAAPNPQSASLQVRVYDRNHKDYHNWDDNENQAWGRFEVENKTKPHQYSKSSRKEQSQYWNWRHDNPDKH
jgi:hypothetical protein